MLSLNEAIRSDKLAEYIDQEEKRGAVYSYVRCGQLRQNSNLDHEMNGMDSGK